MVTTLTAEVREAILGMFSALAKSNKIIAIKALRQLTGLDLKEAKQLMDEVWKITTGCRDVGAYDKLKKKNVELQIEIEKQRHRNDVLRTAFSKVIDSI